MGGGTGTGPPTRKNILIVVLRRDPEDLTAEEKSILKGAFPTDDITYMRSDPVDCHEHAEIVGFYVMSGDLTGLFAFCRISQHRP